MSFFCVFILIWSSLSGERFRCRRRDDCEDVSRDAEGLKRSNLYGYQPTDNKTANIEIGIHLVEHLRSVIVSPPWSIVELISIGYVVLLVCF
jgi:hypothetical protein